MKSPASDLIEAAKELNIEVLNPSPEVLEEAFGFYLTTIRVEKRTMDVDEGQVAQKNLLRRYVSEREVVLCVHS